MRTARRAIRERAADVVMGGGGFVAGPAGLAAATLRVPLVLTEADSHLGLANRLLARRARRVCLAFPIAGREGEPLPGHRAPGAARAVLEADRDAARRRFGIAADDRCLLVMGGSQGARSINTCAAPRHSPAGDDRGFHVLHLAGRRDYAELASGWRRPAERYTLLEYEPDLGDCLAASRPRPRPLRRLDLRGHGGGPPRDPGALSARDRGPPDRERRLDGRAGAPRS